MEVLNDVLAPGAGLAGENPKKTKDAWEAAAQSGVPASLISMQRKSEALPPYRPSLDANTLLDHNVRLADLQRLSNDGFLVVSHAASKHDACGHDHGDDDGALQTLHGLLSFG